MTYEVNAFKDFRIGRIYLNISQLLNQKYFYAVGVYSHSRFLQITCPDMIALLVARVLLVIQFLTVLPVIPAQRSL